ncbi:MAG: sugar kinase [Chloroflexota bacterium]
MARFDVTTFGEGQLRYSVPIGTRIEQARSFDVNITGTEANVSSLVSRLGWRCGWITGLPNSPLGRRVASEYGMSGLDMSAVVWKDEGRLATYYVEYGLPPRGTQVYYDRKNTVFTGLTPDDIDWDYLLDTRLLHLSGLTVPLSDSVNQIINEAVKRAKAKKIPISFDMNYRSRIWTTEEAAAAVEPIIRQVDVLFFARGDATRMYGFSQEPEKLIEQLATITDAGFIVASLSKDGIIAWDREQHYFEETHRIDVIDRIGAGDAMVAGVLHGWLQGDCAKALKYGVTTAALALTQYGDPVLVNRHELESLLTNTNADINR